MRMVARVSCACICALLFLPVPVAAQWTSVGDMPAPRRDGNTLSFQNAQAVAAVTAISPDIIRVRFAPARAFGRDHSYAIVNRELGDPLARIAVARGQSEIVTPSLRVAIQHRPFRITILDALGNDLDADDPAMGMAYSGQTLRVWKRLRDDEQVYGFGEKNGRLNKRGRNLGGYAYAMWNSDTFAYDSDTDPIYASIPFFLVLRNGRAHGIFFDNTYRTTFDVGHSSQGRLTFGADGGDVNYYVIFGPHPKDVIRRYTEMTGRMPLPPRWALGYHQCRYSYYPESRVRLIANTFRERQIPGDVIWLDIHYLDGYNPFTWDPERFPDPAKLTADLRAQGFRMVTIIDAHPKKQPGWPVYDSGVAGDHFVKRPDGTIYEAPVWPSNAPKNPGPSVFPDFSKPAAREWWGSLYKMLLDVGVAGIWNDMNEPAVFVAPTWTMPLDVRHDNEGQPTDHREIHNVYGLEMTRSTYEGLLRLRPDARPFVLTRASYAGAQRYAAMWPGDNVSTWSHLRYTVPMLTGMGLSGVPFVGSDIGGFAGAPTPDLYTRWLQAGVFYPFMRTHTTFGTPDQEPWSYGSRHETINRRAIELRYQLLPQIYNVMYEASTTGIPAMRPLVLEYPEDPRTWDLDDEFMWGSDLLIAPVLSETETVRDLYLPKGEWYDFWTTRRYQGGVDVHLPVTLDQIPIFVRGGAFVFRGPVIQHTGQMSGQPLEVHVYPAPSSDGTLYEDDGETQMHRQGNFMLRTFHQRRTGNVSATIEIEAPQGRFRPATRDLVLWLPWEGEPSEVTSGGTALTRYSVQDLASRPAGWTISETGFVVVKQPDRFEASSISIAR
jgi:alpha-glucosidase